MTTGRLEPLGNVILEAWNAEKPVVAAASDGPRWLIDHLKTGFLFDIDESISAQPSIVPEALFPRLQTRLQHSARKLRGLVPLCENKAVQLIGLFFINGID